MVVQSGPDRSAARLVVDRFGKLHPGNLLLTGVSRGFICHGNGNYPDSLVDIISIIGPWKRRQGSKAGNAGEQARKQVGYPFFEIIQELVERDVGWLPREFLKKVKRDNPQIHVYETGGQIVGMPTALWDLSAEPRFLAIRKKNQEVSICDSIFEMRSRRTARISFFSTSGFRKANWKVNRLSGGRNLKT